MSPSVAQLTPDTVDSVKVAKENIKAQEVKSDNVSIAFIRLTSLSLLISFLPGTLLPILLPLFRREREICSYRTFWYILYLFHISRLGIKPRHQTISILVLVPTLRNLISSTPTSPLRLLAHTSGLRFLESRSRSLQKRAWMKSLCLPLKEKF